MPSGNTSARGSQRTMPVGGTSHSSVLNGRNTSCGYHHESSWTAPTGRPCASRSSTAETIDDDASSPGSVRYQYALPLSVQYDTRVPSTSASRRGAATPDAARSSRAQRAKQSRAPSPATTASSVEKPPSTASMSPCQPAKMPASASSLPAGTAITCSWKPVNGASNSVRPSGATNPSGITTAGRKGNSLQRARSASLNTGRANSVY